jgi:sugar phosphate isomerase/epimerase
MSNFSSRRRFLRQSALGLGALALGSNSLGAFPGPPPEPGLQLYSIRDDLERDLLGTVKALADMGYRQVEGFDFQLEQKFGRSPRALVQLLREHGIRMPSTHAKFRFEDYLPAGKTISDNLKKSIDLAAELGVRYYVYPWADEQDRKRITEYPALLQAAGAYAQKQGVQLGYHNHEYEYQQRGPDGRLMVEWLLQEVDPAVLVMEMDLYWVTFAGYNPLDWFERYPGRWALAHLKDLAPTPTRETIEVGDGVINFEAILRAKRKSGMKLGFIELEHYKTSPLQGVKRAKENMKRLRY